MGVDFNQKTAFDEFEKALVNESGVDAAVAKSLAQSTANAFYALIVSLRVVLRDADDTEGVGGAVWLTEDVANGLYAPIVHTHAYVGGSGAAGRVSVWADASTVATSTVVIDGDDAYPAVSGVGRLGTPSQRWNQVHVSDSVHMGHNDFASGPTPSDDSMSVWGFLPLSPGATDPIQPIVTFKRAGQSKVNMLVSCADADGLSTGDVLYLVDKAKAQWARVAGTMTEGHVIKVVGGIPTWSAP